MTENKRFRIEYVQGNPTIFHIVENGEHIDEIKIVDLLNELHEENQEFRKRTKELIAVSLDYPTINLDLIAEAIKSLRELIE